MQCSECGNLRRNIVKQKGLPAVVICLEKTDYRVPRQEVWIS